MESFFLKDMHQRALARNQKQRPLVVPILGIYMLNLLDYFATRALVSKFGIDIELNPVMHYLLQVGLFDVYKIGIVAALLVLLYKGIKQEASLYWSIPMLIMVYGILAAYHFQLIFG